MRVILAIHRYAPLAAGAAQRWPRRPLANQYMSADPLPLWSPRLVAFIWQSIITGTSCWLPDLTYMPAKARLTSLGHTSGASATAAASADML
jgi:hypothetical protein